MTLTAKAMILVWLTSQVWMSCNQELMDLNHLLNSESTWLKRYSPQILLVASKDFLVRQETAATSHHLSRYLYTALTRFCSHLRHFKIHSTKAPPRGQTNSKMICFTMISTAWYNDQAQHAPLTHRQMALSVLDLQRIVQQGQHAYSLDFFKIMVYPDKLILEWFGVPPQGTINRWFLILIIVRP